MSKGTILVGITLELIPVASQALALARKLRARSYEVVFVTQRTPELSVALTADTEILRWPSSRPTRPADARFLMRLIKDRQPVGLIAHFASVNLMMVCGWLRHVPLRIAWYHTTEATRACDAARKPSSFRSLYRWRKALVYRLATNVVANSEAASMDLQKRYRLPASRCQVVYNCLAKPDVDENCGRAEQQPARVLCVGRFDPSKGQDVLIKALPTLLGRVLNFVVEFIGDGPMRYECEQLARKLGVSSFCRFLGQLPHECVLKSMANAMITVVPSRAEAFGLVNIESMSVGTPVIASRVEGIPEVVRNGVDGLLVQPDNPAELGARLADLLLQPGLRRRLATSAKERFLQKFEQNRVVEPLADWLDNTLCRQLHEPISHVDLARDVACRD